MPRLLLVGPNEIATLVYNPDSKILARVGHAEMGWARTAACLDETIMLAGNSRIELLSSDLTPLAASYSRRVSAIAAGGQHIYAAVEGDLVCFDGSLREVDRLRTESRTGLFPMGKGIDDILVYGDVIYLIDDVVSPLYVFVVDASNKGNLSLRDYHCWEGTNASLSLQFVNPALNQWIVKEDCGHMGGSAETLVFFDLTCSSECEALSPPAPHEIAPRARRQVFSWWTFEDRAPKGYRIKDVTAFPAHWAIIQDVRGNTHLAKVRTKSERVRFSYLTPLVLATEEPSSPWDSGTGFLLKRSGDLLFATPRLERDVPHVGIRDGDAHVPLFVFDIGRKRPVQVARIDLVGLGIVGVYDLVVF